MRKLLSLIVVFVAVAATAPTASAVTYGEPDAGEHPYVGFMIYFDPAEPGWFSCSGTRLDEDTLLTAAHCTYGVGTDGEVVLDPDGAPITTGGTDVWVTFGEVDVLAGWPARADSPAEQALYDARSAWLDANPAFYEGEAIPHPAYDDFAGFPVTYDVGVVQLTEDVLVGTTCRETPEGEVCYGELAPLGTAETLAGSPRNRNAALIESVGYGIQPVHPVPPVTALTTRGASTPRTVTSSSSNSRTDVARRPPGMLDGR